jgi:uncharacterized membrane protein YhhN
VPTLSPLALVAICSAALAIASAPWALGQPWLNVVFKPLATVAIIVFAAGRGHSRPLVRRWVLIGLVLSLVGDVALLWPERGFLPGLLAFLMAHLAYLMAFTREHHLAARTAPFVAYAVLAGAVLAWLWPGVPPDLRGPVAGYVVCLAAMAAQTAVLWRLGSPGGGGLALGGLLFLCSDALLAVNKFASPLPMASLWILTSYWWAQWLIAGWLPARRVDGAAS